MALEKRTDGKLALTTDTNKVIDVVNSLGRHDFITSGRVELLNSETWWATVTGALSGSQGYYKGTFKITEACPQSGAIASTDFGNDDTNESVVIANLAEIYGGTPLIASGTSTVVFGRIVGFNSIANGGVGTSTEDGLPILAVGNALCAGIIFEVNLTQTGGSSTAGYTYEVKDLAGNVLGGSDMTAMAPAFRWFAPASINIATAATTGTGYYNTSGTFVLKSADEVPKLTNC